MEISDIISLVSLFVSIFAGIYTWNTRRKLNKQQLQINEYTLLKNKKDEEEEKKAEICANAFKTGNNGWRIRVFNNGKGLARNIKIYSDDILDDDSGIQLMVKQASYPLLNKGDHFDIVMILFEGHNPAPIIRLVWDDEFGHGRERTQALNLVF
jgi:hypothetical protein